jgi:sugar diacid utilization regulator
LAKYVSNALKNPNFEATYKMKCENLTMGNCDENFNELKKTYSNVKSRLLVVEEKKKKSKNSFNDLLLIILMLSSLNNNQNNNLNPYLLDSNTRRNDILPLLALLSPPATNNYIYPYNNLYG